jgi:sigma-B regulation protein RsbU (phosphoserine phosphatase)
MARHVLTLRPETSQIAVMNDWLRAVFAGEAVSRRVAEDMKLCLNEAVANAILHGAAGQPDAWIEIELTVDGGRAVARLSDDCPAFDPLAAPDAGRISGLGDARVGGFGIGLIRETATALDYRRVDGRNVLTIACGMAG